MDIVLSAPNGAEVITSNINTLKLAMKLGKALEKRWGKRLFAIHPYERKGKKRYSLFFLSALVSEKKRPLPNLHALTGFCQGFMASK